MTRHIPAEPSVGLMSTIFGPLRTTRPNDLGGIALSAASVLPITT